MSPAGIFGFEGFRQMEVIEELRPEADRIAIPRTSSSLFDIE